jgi:lipid-binding SYLF domain-containing protein
MKKYFALTLILVTWIPTALLAADPDLEAELKDIMLIVMKVQDDLKSQMEDIKHENIAVTKAGLELGKYIELLRQKNQALKNENLLLRSKLSGVTAKEIDMASLPQPEESPSSIDGPLENPSDPARHVSSTDSTPDTQQDHDQVENLDPIDLARVSDVYTPRDTKLMETSKKAIQILKSKNSKLEEWFEDAYGYVIFPSVVKLGVGLGAALGKGEVYENEIFIGEARLTQGSLGLQLGGHSYTEIIFFENQQNLQNFKEGVFALGAQTSAVIVTKGAATNARYERGIAVFTGTKGGLMIEASVGGQRLKFIPKEVNPSSPEVVKYSPE